MLEFLTSKGKGYAILLSYVEKRYNFSQKENETKNNKCEKDDQNDKKMSI